MPEKMFLCLILPTASPVVAVVKGGSVTDRKKSDAVKRKEFEAEALPHMDALYRTALRLAKNQSDAEDLVQEAYAKAYRFWDKFESG